MSVRSHNNWVKEEEDYLVFLSGSNPFSLLVRKFRIWAAKRNYPIRTASSIAMKMIRMGLSRESPDNNFTISALAKGLKMTPYAIKSLILSGKLGFVKVRKRHIVSRKQAIKAILSNPEYFSQCDEDDLFWILEKRRLVRQVKGVAASRKGLCKPVRCHKPGGEVKAYPSIKAAGRDNYLSHTSITRAIARNGTGGGMKWEYC